VIGLPSLQALDSAPGPRIWLAAEATDMRCGFDRLAQHVQAVIGADPLSGHLFLFRSRGGNRLKILTWDRDGYVLWYKRLEVGVFKLPRVAPGAGSIGKEDAEQVQFAIEELSAEFREAILLREFEELSYRKIAVLLNCPVGTVMSRLGRARAKLRTLLGKTSSRPLGCGKASR
jgi:transposase